MEEIQAWLKGSLLGIIILGAVGSILAAIFGYFVTRVIPKALGKGKTHLLSHKQVFDRIFAKRQHNLIITYFMYHMTYIVTGAVFGAFLLICAFLHLVDGNSLEYSHLGIFLLSGGFYFICNGIYHSFFIERAYREKLLLHLKEAGENAQDANENG